MPSSKPKLPSILIPLALIIPILDFISTLTMQPLGYWMDYGLVIEGNPVGRALLAADPIFFVFASVLYLAIMNVLFRILPYSLALAMWTVVCFLHLRGFAGNTVGILLGKLNWSSFPTEVAYFVISGIISAALGIVLSRSLAPNHQPVEAVSRENMPRRLRFIRCRPGWIVIVWWTIAGIAVFQVKAIFREVFREGWRPIVVEHRPTGRHNAAIAYDANQKQVVLFGGWACWGRVHEQDTWTWDGRDWTQVDRDSGPSGRAEHAMAYDQTRRMVVLFGGKNENGLLDDTWEWDGSQWHPRNPEQAPPARVGHRLIYDVERHRVVLYGGSDDSYWFSDGWEWDGTNWLPIEFSTTPRIAYAYAIVEDSARQRKFAFLGSEGTWIWDEMGWRQLSLESEPQERVSHTMVYDSLREQIVLFGGATEGWVFGDTWAFDGESWRELSLPYQPARWGHAMFYDPLRQRAVIWGGVQAGSGHCLHDMWELVLD
jgi:hypothetical protein